MMSDRYRSLLPGLGIIALANGVAIANAAYNRTGEPTSTLVVSGREARTSTRWSFDEHENSGLAIELLWCLAPHRDEYLGGCWDHRAAWATSAKLVELGFHLDVDPKGSNAAEHYNRIAPRPVFLAMELDGEAYEQSVEQLRDRARRDSIAAQEHPDSATLRREATNVQQERDRVERRSSRLYIVDAALDPSELRAKYSDRSKYAIVRGTIRPRLDIESKTLRGEIADVQGLTINVPHALRPLFDRQRPRGRYEIDTLPSMAITVGWGRRFEPYIVGAKK
jgi:hypothetical protein